MPSANICPHCHSKRCPSNCAERTCWERDRENHRFLKNRHNYWKKNPNSVVWFSNPALSPIILQRVATTKAVSAQGRGWQEDMQELLGRDSSSHDCAWPREGHTKLYPECCSAVAFWNKVEALRHFPLVLTPSGHSQDNYNVFWVYKRTGRFCNQSLSLCFSP